MLKLQRFLLDGGSLADLENNLHLHLHHHPTLPLVGFTYDQLDSPKLDPIVREARGILLEKDSWELIAKGLAGCTDQIMRLLGHQTHPRPQENYDGIGDAFELIDPSKVKLTYIVGLLSITSTMPDKIPARKSLYKKTLEYVKEFIPDEIDLLSDLE